MVGDVPPAGLQGDAIPEEALSPLGLGWPNVVSVLRMLVVPVIVLLILAETDAAAYAAAALFAAGAATDGVDGYLARRHGTTTRTGQWLDPLADKVLVVAPVIALAALDRFPVWAAVAIVAREVVIVGLRSFLGTRGRGMPATWPAKLKTVLQLLAITLYILPLGDGADPVRLPVLVAAVVLTLATGAMYVAAVRR